MGAKVLSIFRKVIITVGVLVLLVIAANEIVYRVHIPDAFADANWSGTWDSAYSKLINGRVLTTIPDPIEENVAFESPMLIYYNLWSPYKPGQVKTVKLSGSFGDENIQGESNINDSLADDHKALLAHYLKAYLVFDTGQQIEYTGMKVIDDTKILGDYISTLPGDRGEFKLSLKE